MGKKKRNKAGRPRQPDAKRHQTTREGQGRGLLGPTPELLHKRLAMSGDLAGTDFPPDVMLAQKLINQDQRDEALRFAMLAWLLFKSPTASCAAVYERMVAEGFGGGDFAPRNEGESDERYHSRIRSQAARFQRMLQALGAGGAGPVEEKQLGDRRVIYRSRVWTRIEGTMFGAVRQSTQFMQHPRFVLKLAGGEHLDPEDYAEMWRLTRGFRRLVAARTAEDRHWRRSRGHHGARIAAAMANSLLNASTEGTKH